MRRLVILPFAAIAAVSCTMSQSGYSEISDYTETPSEYHIQAFGQAGEIRQADRYFIFRAGVGGLYDIALADIANGKSTNPAVKDLVQRVLAPASERNHRLWLISQQDLGIAPPTLLDRPHAARLDRLAGLSGTAFDDAYVRDRLARSEREIAIYRAEASGGSEPLLTKFAADTLPQLDSEQRLAAALAPTAAR